MGSQDKANGTPLHPPLFWLDKIFKLLFIRNTVYKRYNYLSTYIRVSQQYKRLEFKVYDYLIVVKSFSSNIPRDFISPI